MTREIFRLALHGSAENGVHPCTPPLRGPVQPNHAFFALNSHGTARKARTAKQLRLLAACSTTPLPGRGALRRPVGRRTGSAPFYDRAMDGESENPRVTRSRRELCREKGPSLWLLSLWPWKEKVTRPRSGWKLSKSPARATDKAMARATEFALG